VLFELVHVTAQRGARVVLEDLSAALLAGVGDDVGRGPQIMYPTSAPDDARCEDFSISGEHKPAVPMIALMGTSPCPRRGR
jgi:hypothetical protein